MSELTNAEREAAEQLRLALGSVRFYARRALQLGATENDVQEQVAHAVKYQAVP